MEVVNCPRCGKIFTKFSDPLCENCMKAEEALFNRVRVYINEHQDCTIPEVIKETGVTVKKIMKYLREGRLEVSQGMSGDLTCEKCGKPILTGRFCNNCIISINQQAEQLFGSEKQKQKNTTRETHSIWKT